MKVVTGMHRSGTSFVTQLLAELGADLGDESRLLAADKYNAAGYKENIDVMLLNDRLILGDRFYREDYRLKPAGQKPLVSTIVMTWLKGRYLLLRSTAPLDRRAHRFQDRIAELGAEYDGILVKDPRFSLTLRYWREHADVAEVLYSFRHPWEVASSLRKRERLPLWLGLRVWAFHVRSFLDETNDLPVTYVNFNNFFDRDLAEDECRRCFAFCNGQQGSKQSSEILKKVLRSDLKNYSSPDIELPPDCQEQYSRLLELHAARQQGFKNRS